MFIFVTLIEPPYFDHRRTGKTSDFFSIMDGVTVTTSDILMTLLLLLSIFIPEYILKRKKTGNVSKT
jgi:hypothetical protein